MRRFFITLVAILVVLFSAMGVESLIMGDHNSILRQTLTSPVKQFIDGSRGNPNQVVVGIDNQIDPYMQQTYFKATLEAIDHTVRASNKFLVVKFLDRESIASMIADGEIDFLISESDFYAELAFNEKIKAIAMLWRAQAKSPSYSAASTIVVNSSNTDIYTLTDVATGSYRVAATSAQSFAGFTISKAKLIAEGLPDISITISMPDLSPPASIIFLRISGSIGFRTTSAPIFSASFCLKAEVSKEITLAAPQALAICVAKSPCGPQPDITTDLPTMSSESVANTALPKGSIIEPMSLQELSLCFHAQRAGMAAYSAKPP